jgi:hypothetical protein
MSARMKGATTATCPAARDAARPAVNGKQPRGAARRGASPSMNIWPGTMPVLPRAMLCSVLSSCGVSASGVQASVSGGETAAAGTVGVGGDAVRVDELEQDVAHSLLHGARSRLTARRAGAGGPADRARGDRLRAPTTAWSIIFPLFR